MSAILRRNCWISAIGLLVLLVVGTRETSAQTRLQARLRGTSPLRINAEAAAGPRFGVGRITVSLPKQLEPTPLGLDGLRIDAEDGRVLYPAIDNPAFREVAKKIIEGSPLTTGGPIREQIGGLLRDILDTPPSVTVFFLFTGEEPLNLTLHSQVPHRVVVQPQHDEYAYRRLMDGWWRAYAPPPRLLQPAPDYPPLVAHYLRSMLALRLNLRLPERHQSETWQDQLRDELGLMLGTEEVRVGMLQDRVLGLNNLALPADQPLPNPITPPVIHFADVDPDVEIEPIAMRVPAECFYVRYGSFSNFLWAQDTMALWNDDLQNLYATRGLNYRLSQHMQDRLVLKQNALSRLLGDTAVADVALIGTDLFFREGAAIGLLFYARNGGFLAADIKRQRLERVNAGGVSEEKFEIDGQPISFLSSPDGAVRSFYVASGDYHFVTSSRTLARRFIETSSGKGALGASEDFRHARTQMPLSRKDTMFVYFSDAFFRNFTGPQYRVEMIRRLEAAADIDLVQLARLAAATEGVPASSIEELIAAHTLAESFGPRPDGSRTVMDGDVVYDSMRGQRGNFIPVPDVVVDNVTSAETTAYQKFADFYSQQWGHLDPTIIALRRHALADRQERVVIDVRLSPFAAKHYELLTQFLGPADQKKLAPIRGNIAEGEAVLNNQRVLAGVADFGSSVQYLPGKLFPLGLVRDMLVGYIGTTGPAGLLAFLDEKIARETNEMGIAGSDVGLWRRKYGEFTVFSLQRGVLDVVPPQLHFVEAERPAQVRLHVNDPSEARMTPFLNSISYLRTRETSLGNLRLLRDLDQQFRVPAKDALKTAEFLLDAKLMCPLGGKYVLTSSNNDNGGSNEEFWTSTALFDPSGRRLSDTEAPPDYVGPPMSWFRGLDFDAVMDHKNLSARVEVIMQTPSKQ